MKLRILTTVALLWVVPAAGLASCPQGEPLPPGGALPPVVGPGTGGPAGPGGGGPHPRGGARAGGEGRSPSAARAKRQNEPERIFAWDVWWDLNDDRVLKGRSLARVTDVDATDSDSILGDSGKSVVAKATAADIRQAILPALRRASKDDFHGARRQAVIALGKIADSDDVDVFETLRARMADLDWEVRTASALGLGLLGSRDGLQLLVPVMKDEPAAREFSGLGTHSFSPRERAFAALGIGLVGVESGLDPEHVQAVVATAREKAPHPDVRVFAALALGIMHAHAAVPDLKKIAFDETAPEVVRAHAVIALAKLGDRASVPLLARQGLSDRSVHVQRSSAMALGLLTDASDARTIELLIEQSRSAADRGVRNFAIIAMGQVGSAPARLELLQLLKGGSQHDRTFAALGCGLLASKNEPVRGEIGRALQAVFADARAETERAAFAIGLAIADFKPAAPAILLALSSAGSPELRGHLATACGLLGNREAIPVLQDIVSRTPDGGLMMKAAIALGALGDPGAVKVLVKAFEQAGNSQPALHGATLALGLIGDRSAVPPLVRMLDGKDAGHDYARAYAAMALGILGDKREIRALSVVQENSNYLATTEWLPELLAIY